MIATRSDRSRPAGVLLRRWREARQLSQLALSVEAGVSSRHLCFIETGRAQPSRDMIHRLADVMDVPLRERNALLLSAGFAPAFPESGLDLAGAELAPVRMALDAMLGQHEPFPAVVMGRHWDVVRANQGASRLFAFLLGPRADGPANVLRLMFSAEGLRPYVKNWHSAAEALIRRVYREVVGGVVDERTRALLDEVLSYPDVPKEWRQPSVEVPLLPVVPVTFEKDGTRFNYFSTVTTVGTAQDVLLQELRVESFFPFDDETRNNAQILATQGSN
jgi:transcriptional regulator with XRE-family HTH domain